MELPELIHLLQTFFLVNVVYAGPLAEGMKYVEPLKKLKPLAQNITEIPWKDIEPSSKFGIDAQACIKGFKHSVYSINLYQIDVPALTNFTNYVEGVYKTYPGLQRAIWALVQYPNRVAQEVPDDATAYPWRNATAYV